MELHFTNLLIIVLVGFLAPLTLGFFPRLLLPSVVFEIVLGIVIGPAVLGWVHVDDPVTVMSIIGLAFLLFLAGLEIEFDQLRGKVLKVTALGFALSFALALVRESCRGRRCSTTRCSWRSCSRPPRSAWSSRCSRTQARWAPRSASS